MNSSLGLLEAEDKFLFSRHRDRRQGRNVLVKERLVEISGLLALIPFLAAYDE